MPISGPFELVLGYDPTRRDRAALPKISPSTGAIRSSWSYFGAGHQTLRNLRIPAAVVNSAEHRILQFPTAVNLLAAQ